VSQELRITIIGDGAMATVCALLLHGKKHSITLWSAFPDYARQMARSRENTRFLPGFSIPTAVQITSEAPVALDRPELLINAVPCQYLRGVWSALAPSCPAGAVYVSVTKGIENDTLLRPTQILHELLGPVGMVALSGPSIALEVAGNLPATLVAASPNAEYAKRVQSIFSTSSLRVYTNDDIAGVELAGAMKNVIAIAAGIIDGLRIGDNAKAALLTRGLVEITRLGMALGARKETFSGLAGLGDLVTTCISPHGRNRRLGELIGRGVNLAEAQQQIQSVVEGVATTKSVLDLAARYHVEMPLTRAVAAVIFDGQKPLQAIRDLMTRQPKDESV
jgi:glycerol-3-phosphate dehydrogenase (NAD(P)+)